MKEALGKLSDGSEVWAYHLKNTHRVEAVILNYGGVIRNLFVPDRDGKPVDVALGYDGYEGYTGASCFLGAAIGPAANRVAKAQYFIDGVTYHLPVNEAAPYHNHIHGFLHKREHTVISHHADENCAVLRTSYDYDEKDPFFQYLPLRFRVELTFTLSEYGLEHKIALINLSEKALPVSVATHTTIQAPFLDGAKPEDMRLTVPIGKRCELNERCLPTERLLDLKLSDLEYKNGTKCPVLQNLDNDMYQAEAGKLDGQDYIIVRQGDILAVVE